MAIQGHPRVCKHVWVAGNLTLGWIILARRPVEWTNGQVVGWMQI